MIPGRQKGVLTAAVSTLLAIILGIRDARLNK